MRKRSLDDNLIDKLEKRGLKNVGVRISQKAHKLGISSEAALVLLAKELGIGTSVYQKKLTSHQQSEIRDNLLNLYTSKTISKKVKNTNKQSKSKAPYRTILNAAVEYMIKDPELKSRCKDLIMAPKNFDRAINQATLVLEERIRKKSIPPVGKIGKDLVNYAVKSNFTSTILKLSDDENEQDGYANILRGIVGAYRNPTHHHLVSYSREDALKVCANIDFLLKIIDDSQKVR